MTSKLFQCNFSAANIYEPFFFFNVCVGKIACFYFCLHFYKAFVGGSIHHQSVIYEQGKEICCCCLECLKSLSIKTDFSEESKDYFTDLKKLLIQYYYVYTTGLLMDYFL